MNKNHSNEKEDLYMNKNFYLVIIVFIFLLLSGCYGEKSIDWENTVENKESTIETEEGVIETESVTINFDNKEFNVAVGDIIGDYEVIESKSVYIKTNNPTETTPDADELTGKNYYPMLLKFGIKGDIELTGKLKYHVNGYQGSGFFIPDEKSMALLPTLAEYDKELYIYVQEYFDDTVAYEDINYENESAVTIAFSNLYICKMDSEFEDFGDIISLEWNE